MKKVFLITALAMLTGALVLDARAQSNPAPEQQDPKELEFVQSWYETCIGKKPIDEEKCYQLSKELTEKHPKADPKYLEFANKRIASYKFSKASDKFNTALKDYFGGKPDSAKLEALFTAGDEFLEIESDPQSPNHLYVVGWQALAARQAVAADAYKNYDKVKTYFDRALKAFETLNPPPDKAKEYSDLNLPNLRELVQANINQCLGYILTLTSPDQPEAQAQALVYIEKSIKVRSQGNKDIGWKDPFNYNMRRGIYLKQYQELSKQYATLTDEQKTGDAGKALLKQINEVLDKKLIPEDARLIAVANKPEFKDVKNDATEEFNNFWKFRVDDPAKAAGYLKAFEADPTIEGPPVPAKADDGTGTAVPNATGGTTKLTAGSSGVPGAASSNSTTSTATGTTKKAKKRTRKQ